jgi:hypothetical protein
MSRKKIYALLLFAFSCNAVQKTIFQDSMWLVSKKRNFQEPQSYQEIEAICMTIWTKLDVIRAIHIPDHYKINFIKHLIEEVIYLYATTMRYLTHLCPEQDVDSTLIKAINNLKEAVSEIFPRPALPHEVTLVYLLEQLTGTMLNHQI